MSTRTLTIFKNRYSPAWLQQQAATIFLSLATKIRRSIVFVALLCVIFWSSRKKTVVAKRLCLWQTTAHTRTSSGPAIHGSHLLIGQIPRTALSVLTKILVRLFIAHGIRNEIEGSEQRKEKYTPLASCQDEGRGG